MPRPSCGPCSTRREYRAASRNTLNAHYTDAAYVQAMWAGLQRLGFDGGAVLEPGCGSGTFIGFAPAGAEMTGVELDPTTAGICRALYPGATVLAESFAETRAPEGFFDAAVGNVPFGRFALSDPVHNPGGHSVHNHFLLKSLHLTRPGGMVALLTSRYTLDAQNPAARRELAQLGDLVFALRLPEGAHRRAAGTDAVTDLVVFRRRGPGEEPAGEAFERAVRTPVASGEEAVVNEYFVAHPGNVLGELYVGRGMYGDDELSVRAQGDVAAAFAAAIEREAAAAVTRAEGFRPAITHSPTAPIALVPRSERLAERTIVVVDDGFARVENGAMLPHAVPRTQAAELRALCGLRDTAKALLEAGSRHQGRHPGHRRAAGRAEPPLRRLCRRLRAGEPVLVPGGRPARRGRASAASPSSARPAAVSPRTPSPVSSTPWRSSTPKPSTPAKPRCCPAASSPLPPPASAPTPPRTPWPSAWTSGPRSTWPRSPASSVSRRAKPASVSAGWCSTTRARASSCLRPSTSRATSGRSSPPPGKRRWTTRATWSTSRLSRQSCQPTSAQLRSAPAWARPGSTWATSRTSSGRPWRTATCVSSTPVARSGPSAAGAGEYRPRPRGAPPVGPVATWPSCCFVRHEVLSTTRTRTVDG